MQLRSFQISNYRSVNLSGDVKTVKTTALVGRNESGKSNVLRALHSLNPADGVKPLSPLKISPDTDAYKSASIQLRFSILRGS